MKKYTFLDLARVTAPWRDELVAAATRVIDSGRYIGGPEVEIFEKNMGRLTGAPYVVGVSNGLDALRLVLRAWILMGRLSQGDSVAVAANTYIASVLAIMDAGLKPVLVEPDETTMNLSAKGLREALETEDVKAVMPVHLYGRVCWDDDMASVVSRNNLLVIEDAAQAIGACASADGLFGGRMAGAIGHAAAFSFYPTKNVGALGDAGAVTTHDEELAHTVRMLANYGGDRRYHNVYAGFNCRMDPMQAAMIDVKLRHIDEENDARRRNAEAYLANVTNPLVRLPLACGGDNTRECVWHQFVVRCSERDRLMKYLEDNGVQTDIHYAVPPHMQPALSSYGLQGKLPVAEGMANEVLSLPISSATSPQEAMEIAAIVNRFE